MQQTGQFSYQFCFVLPRTSGASSDGMPGRREDSRPPRVLVEAVGGTAQARLLLPHRVTAAGVAAGGRAQGAGAGTGTGTARVAGVAQGQAEHTSLWAGARACPGMEAREMDPESPQCRARAW